MGPAFYALRAFCFTLGWMSIPFTHEPLSAEGNCLVLKIHVDFSFPDDDLREAIKDATNVEVIWQRGKHVPLEWGYVGVGPAYTFNVVKVKVCKDPGPDPVEAAKRLFQTLDEPSLAFPLTAMYVDLPPDWIISNGTSKKERAKV
jgi:hypothetical protein